MLSDGVGQALLERFSELRTLEETREMLHEQGYILLADHSQSYLLLSCLEDEMNGKVGHSHCKEGTHLGRQACAHEARPHSCTCSVVLCGDISTSA